MNPPQRRRFIKAPLLFILIAVSGIGCAVDQKKEIATYRKVIDGPDPVKWTYQPGEPLTLEQCLILANRNDEQLATGGENYLQALIDKERKFSAFLPTIDVQPTYTYDSTRGKSGGSSPAAGGSSSGVKLGQFQTPVVGSYNIFNGFQDVANFRKAGYTAQQQQALLLDLQQTILLNVAQAYYLVVTNERSVTVLLNSNSVQNERIRDMQGRQQAGIARPLDVAQTEATAAATRVQLIQAQNNVRTARIALAFLTSSEVQDAPLDDRLFVPEVPLPEVALKEAEKVRQDVQASEAALEAARQAVQAAIGQYYPSVSLDVDYFLKRSAFLQPALWTTILEVNIPVFSAGVIEANVRTAWSQLRQAALNEQRTRRMVAEQVRTAFENLAGSRKRIAELKIEVAAARDALEESQVSYQAGLATNLDVLTAIDTLLSAQLGLVTERLNYKVYYLQLLRSEGKLARPDTLPPATGPVSRPADEELNTPNVIQPGPGAGPAPENVPQTGPSTAPGTAPTTAPETSPATGPATAPTTVPGK